jgi:succinoglycan biosynthesis transport protein ExoP
MAVPQPASASEPSSAPMLTRVMRIAMRRKWLILGAVVAALLAGLVITLLTTPLYTASTTIEISREASKVVNIEGVEPESQAVDQEFYQTQYGLLRSRSLAERVARDLRLADDAAFFEMFGKSPDGLFSADNQRRVTASEREARVREAGDILLENVGVAPVRLSRLVEVSFTSPSPEFSFRVANAWTRHFIQSNLERRFEATSYARKFLEDRLEQLRRRLEESERQLVGYAAQQRIITLSSGGNKEGNNSGERSIIADDLAALNAERADATADRIRAESRLRQAGGTPAEVLQNTAISNLRLRRGELAGEYAKMMEQFEPQYPPARSLASQIEQLDRTIAREEGRVGQSLATAYRESVQREQSLQRKVENLKSDLLDLRRRSIQYNIYQREVDTNRELYNGLLQRYKEIGVAGGVGTNNVSIVDPAEVPERPSRPNVPLNLLLSLLFGVGLGAAAAVAAEQIDETIADPEAVSTSLGLPLLGVVPKAGDTSPMEALRNPKSPLVEAYLSVQTNLEFATEHGVPRSIAVSSTRPAEGKSTTAYAIAASLVRRSRKVVLVDGDMRSPSVHHLLGIDNKAGLSNYLAGNDELESLLVSVQPGLHVMSAGPTPPNAAELLTGERFKSLLERLLLTHDHVVVDSPPVMGIADAPLIASKVEGVIYAVESHGTKGRQIRTAIDRLSDAQAHLLGIVLTKFEAKRAHLGYGYEYGYGYGRNSSETE